MKPRTLLVLALVVAALAAFVLLFEREAPSTDERTAAAKKVVPAKADELTSLAIEWNGARARFERDPKPATKPAAGEIPPARRWRMLEPFATAADSSAVDALAGQLTGLDVDRSLVGAARADVGLEPPRGKVEWATPAASGALEIGGKVPASSDVVVAASGRTDPAVVPDYFVATLEKAPGEWRSREVVTAARADVEKVTLRTPGAPDVVLAKAGETLTLVAPVADVADREAVDQLFTDLAGLRVETFLDPPLTETTTAALATPAGSIEIETKGAKAPLVVELGGGEPMPGRRVARAGTQAFVATTKLLDAIRRPAAEWRSRHWTRFENWRIERLRAEDAVGSLVLERKDGAWRRDGVEVPFAAASDLLYAIASAKADVVREDASAVAAAKPAITFVLADADGNEETLTLGAPAPGDGGASPARASGRNLTLLLPPTTVADVTSKLGALRAAEPVADATAKSGAASVPTPASPAPAATPPSGGN